LKQPMVVVITQQHCDRDD